MKKGLLCLGLLAFTATGFAQGDEEKEHMRADNLVPNPSFENITKVPTTWSQRPSSFNKKMVSWRTPTETHPDIFTTRSVPDAWTNPQKHSDGKQMPRTGDNMVGIKVFGTGNTETYWHEYLEVPLKKSLTTGERYYVEFWVLRDKANSSAANNIGASFQTASMNTGSRLPLYSEVKFKAEQIVSTENDQWVKISGVIEADKAYTHMILGNFCGDHSTATKKYPGGKNGGSFYYVDDVTVRPAEKSMKTTPIPDVCPPPPPLVVIEESTSTEVNDLPTIQYETGQTIKLSNVYFETNEAVLLDESKEELDKLADILYDYPLMVIEIRGHTDNVGDDASNLTLSDARAAAVAAYLVKKKTKQSRITSKGFGETKPVASNDTEAGRAQNRRVEFVIIER